MANEVKQGSRILAVVESALRSSRSLHGAVANSQTDESNLRGLGEELESWNEVLKDLYQTATKADTEFTSLNLPLCRCGRACEDLESIIDECVEHSSGSLTKFKDWEKVKYLGSNITQFKNVLASYKSTVRIVLDEYTMRTSTISPHFLTDLENLIASTISDLGEHLHAVNDQLRYLSLQRDTDLDVTEQKKIQDDKQGAEQCLRICTTVSARIEQTLGANAFRNVSTPDDTYHAHVKTSKHSPTALLGTPGPGADASDRAHEHRLNIFEDVSTGDDGSQVIVSTAGYLISAKRVTAGARSMQLMGQMSDDALLHLSQNFDHRAGAKDEQLDTDGDFKERYGKGWKLSTQTH